MKTSNIIKLLASIAIAELSGVIGSLFTYKSIPTWYASITRPELAPPNWVFGPVWTTLFLLMGISLFLVWKRHTQKQSIRPAVGAFALQLVLNMLWSIIFFALQSPGLAFIEVILLWLAILWTIISFSKISKPAAWLLLPYILWVSFAAYLNYSIWLLN